MLKDATRNAQMFKKFYFNSEETQLIKTDNSRFFVGKPQHSYFQASKYLFVFSSLSPVRSIHPQN